MGEHSHTAAKHAHRARPASSARKHAQQELTPGARMQTDPTCTDARPPSCLKPAHSDTRQVWRLGTASRTHAR